MVSSIIIIISYHMYFIGYAIKDSIIPTRVDPYQSAYHTYPCIEVFLQSMK